MSILSAFVAVVAEIAATFDILEPLPVKLVAVKVPVEGFEIEMCPLQDIYHYYFVQELKG